MNTECRQYQERFSEYLDDALDDADREALEAHLESCERCRAELAALRRVVDAVRELPVLRAPETFAAGVREQLAARERTTERRLVRLIWARVLPVAAMFLLVVGATFLVSRNGLFKPDAEEPMRMAMQQEEQLARQAPPPEASLGSMPEVKSELSADSAQDELAVVASGESQASSVMARESRPMARNGGPRLPEPGFAPERLLGQEKGVGSLALPVTDAPGDMVTTLDAAPETDEESRYPMARRDAPRYRRGMEERFLFRQAPVGAVPVPPLIHQVLEVRTEKPTKVLARILGAANRRDVHAVVEVGKDGAVNLYLGVPGEAYTGFLSELGSTDESAEQELRNTGVADGVFLDRMVELYRARRQAAPEAEEQTDWSGEVPPSLRPGGHSPPETVNLQVCIRAESNAARQQR